MQRHAVTNSGNFRTPPYKKGQIKRQQAWPAACLKRRVLALAEAGYMQLTGTPQSRCVS